MTSRPIPRRAVLRSFVGGSLLLPGLVSGLLAEDSSDPLAPKAPHFHPRAKRVIFIFSNGGVSHMDTFDHKPKLFAADGKTMGIGGGLSNQQRRLLKPGWDFKPGGKCGTMVSDLFPHLRTVADELCVIRSMYADVPNHEPSLLLMNCGEARQIRPSMGSWVTYGLGSENQNLPGFIAMCPGGYPIQESQNWQSGFLPGVFQGTYIDTQHTKIEKLIEHIRNNYSSLPEQRAQLDLLQALNTRHQRQRREDAQIEARIQSFELAYRMQMDASDAFDVTRDGRLLAVTEEDERGDIWLVEGRPGTF